MIPEKRSQADAMMSIRPRFVDALKDGSKKVELRRRRPKLQPFDRIWFYTTLPRGCVEVVCLVEKVITASLETIWEDFGSELALTREEYFDYLQGKAAATAIRIASVEVLADSISLAKLRERFAGFHPPRSHFLLDQPLTTTESLFIDSALVLQS